MSYKKNQRTGTSIKRTGLLLVYRSVLIERNGALVEKRTAAIRNNIRMIIFEDGTKNEANCSMGNL